MEDNKLTITMPIGANFGWGICGRYLTREMARLHPVELITEEFDNEDVGDDEELLALRRLRGDLKSSRDNGTFKGPLLQAIQGLDMRPWYLEANGSPLKIGYTFFERDSIKADNIKWAQDYYDTIVAGSSWCEKILNECGFTNTSTIIQGIDDSIFNPEEKERARYKDNFVIFSGGKLELRKGQDLVIRAFKVMQDKFPDVLLINLWYNQWTPSMDTMSISPYIRFEMPRGDYLTAVDQLLHVNGIDPGRVITLPPKPNRQMADIYKNCDIGLFPNRCEGGTNLVLMEYMACAKPAIASFVSGHRDVLTSKNSLPIRSLHPFRVQDRDGKILYRWEEPDLEEIISLLEWAYWHRDELKNIGRSAGTDLSMRTWKDSAEQFLKLIK